MVGAIDSLIILSYSEVVNTVDEVSAGGVMLRGWSITNLTAAVAYLQLFNDVAANITLGTTAPKMVLAVPGAGHISSELIKPLHFDKGFTVASTSLRQNLVTVSQEVLLRYIT